MLGKKILFPYTRSNQPKAYVKSTIKHTNHPPPGRLTFSHFYNTVVPGELLLPWKEGLKTTTTKKDMK